MKKVAIFNVGGASSAYAEIDDVKFVVDLGSGNDFSPVDDFLRPLFQAKRMGRDSTGRYSFAQTFLTHLHNDHVSDFLEFQKDFNPRLLTVPNDHRDIAERLKIDREKVPENETVGAILAEAQRRSPGADHENPDYENPLAVTESGILSLFYNTAEECEQLDTESESEYPSYSNNISLVVYLDVNGHTILFPGDIMGDGIAHLINTRDYFREKLQTRGVDFLIAPHHGLDTSFPDKLFANLPEKKTTLNIISEKKIEKEDTDNRHNVDHRYYSADYSHGFNVTNAVKAGTQHGIITSLGHIVIDLEQQNPVVKRCYSEGELLAEFL